MNTGTPKFGIALLTALMMFVASFQSCDTQKDPFSTTNDGLSFQNDTPRRQAEINKIRVKQPSLQRLFVDSQMIPAAVGGTIAVGDEESGISTITVLPGGINQNTQITFEWESQGFLEGGATFSPHGLQFIHQAIVELSYKDADLEGIDENSLLFWYFNDEIGLWEDVGSYVDTEKKVVVAFLDHFSRYAIAAN